MFQRQFRLLRFYSALMFHLSIVRMSAGAVGTNDITEAWHFQLGSGISKSSAALAPDGTIYQGTFDGRLLALAPGGRLLWTFQTGLEIKSSPAVGDDGTVYFGSRDRAFYAVSSAGKLKWKFATGGWVDSSPAIATDGTAYFGSWDKNFYGLAPDGRLKWKFATSNLITASPAIAADGTIYFGSHDKCFYALAPDGKLKWKFLTGAEIDISPAIGSDGSVYFGSTDGNLYALRPDGTELWRLRTGSYTASSPVIDAEGNLYLGASQTYISVDSKGKMRWQHGTEVPLDTAELLTANGRMFLFVPWLHIGTSDHLGNFDWGYLMSFNANASPNLSPTGMVYECDGAYLYALQSAAAAPLEKSPWPMWRANPQHTGRVQK